MAKLVFRADASKDIGFGHFMRCLSIATLACEEHECIFFMRNPPETAKIILGAYPIALVESNAPEKDDLELQQMGAQFGRTDTLIIDGYTFSDEYRKKLRELFGPVLQIDDLHNTPVQADILLNHDLSSTSADYLGLAEPGTQYYLGPASALVSDMFYRPKLQPQLPNNFFVCFGGADSENMTLECLKRLTAILQNMQIHVLLGGGYVHIEGLQAFAEESKTNSIQVHRNLSSSDVAELMATCQFHITAASTIAYESCVVNSCLFVVQTADNQQHLFASLIEQRLAHPWQNFEVIFSQLNEEEIAAQLARQREAFQIENHRENICDLVHTLLLIPRVTIKMKNAADRWVMVAELEGAVVGEIRVDKIQELQYQVHCSVDKKHQNKELEQIVLSKAMRNLQEVLPRNAELIADVKDANPAAMAHFERLGFTGKEVGGRTRLIFKL